ncbi:PTS sugar transporter subunit IIA [Romboutsia ilealis]|uniref:PTS sugar transporter subunit IIA n=1 Tax=Romboutsia faecis TaxID=2764597 RepID=A0ABR7JK95_9FIRM|nr:PTS sugar transporter subunit IIA [Romboutsia faecis]MBC5995353.1 PTS sugar transporter subunit IIA [Romboutsia faecis]MRN24402.1 PTS sugar transporter subunit IIA [Romboutsia ilealis]
MYKVLLVSHSGLSKGLLDATEMILGDADGVDYIILDESGIEVFSKKLDEKVEFLTKTSEGLLILADIFGGTPFNQSMIKSQQYENVRVVSGANLQMVIEAVMNRSNNIDEVVENIVSSTKDSIIQGIINKNKELELND